MPKSEKGLIDLVANREFLERSADEAIKAVKNKRSGYLTDFIKHRTEYMDAIQNMVMLGDFPEKRYMEREIDNLGKRRTIDTLPFYPWSILLHAIKNALEPLVSRVLICDSSAGTKGKGQVFATLRVCTFKRKYKTLTHVGVADGRKYYSSLLHSHVRRTLHRYIRDALFLAMVEAVILDYVAHVEDELRAERERKLKYCKWADTETQFIEGEKRGVTIGGSVSQLIGNLCLMPIDYYAKRVLGLKFYHRHCDDIIFGAHSQAEGERILHELDREMNKIGVVMKASSHVAPLKDERRGVRGRKPDYCGFVHSRCNERMRKTTKVRFARKLKGVKSRRRRREVISAYWGIAKWGKCRHLVRTILKENGIMSFADVGIKTEKIRTGRDGKRMFDVPLEKIATLADTGADIVVHDFEADITIKEGNGRCVVLFRHAKDSEDNLRKFVTTSAHIIDKLKRAREMESEGKTVFPQPTRVVCQRVGNGRLTYDIE